jgi:surfactin synthase thioesterase subunit
VQNPTLAVYGDHDGFVAASKLRAWAAKLSSQEGSKFRAVEVARGGHFWVEEGALLQLKMAIERFAESLLVET